jgi:hypothetical protein
MLHIEYVDGFIEFVMKNFSKILCLSAFCTVPFVEASQEEDPIMAFKEIPELRLDGTFSFRSLPEGPVSPSEKNGSFYVPAKEDKDGRLIVDGKPNRQLFDGGRKEVLPCTLKLGNETEDDYMDRDCYNDLCLHLLREAANGALMQAAMGSLMPVY